MKPSTSPALATRKPRIAILLADPDSNRAIRSHLDDEADCVLVGAWTHIVEGLSEIEKARPDLVLLGLDHPGERALSTTRWLRHCMPRTRVLAITTPRDHAAIGKILDAGAIGCLSLAAAGLSESSHLFRIFASAAPRAPGAHPDRVPEKTAIEPPTLSQRETTVIRFIADGLVNKEIANRMGVATSTVCHHVKNIYRKLDAHTRTEAVSKYYGAPGQTSC